MPRASRSSKALPLSVGLDIVEIARIKKAGTRAFLKRVFSPSEIAYCQSKKNRWQHFAVRFAAKEAVYKALGLSGVALRDISVSRGVEGAPGVVLRGKPQPQIALSLSHSDHYAAAVAIRS
ncbi:MAG: holo-acyl-carrier protein synthase [Elusimicrobia bacterium]|nr:MAG: holo-acyl-carrier protein synthase [Elusimicrobiota bacterium]